MSIIKFPVPTNSKAILKLHFFLKIYIILDWVNTNEINPESKYYRGHLDPENHENVMNCTYYIVFEQNYKNYQWWDEKKKRMDNKNEEQTKVNI